MDSTLLTDKGVVGILAFVIIALIAVIKVLWDAWRDSENEKYSLGREVISALNNNDTLAKDTKENFKEVKQLIIEVRKTNDGVNR